MSKFIIGLDVDGVVADLVNPILALNNFYCNIEEEDKFVTKGFTKTATEKDITTYRMEQILGDRQCGLLWGKAEKIEIVRKLPMYEGAKVGIEALREIGRVVFVTTPSFTYKNWQVERNLWLQSNIPYFEYSDLVSLNDKTLFAGNILIDDAEHNLRRWKDVTGKPSIKVARPWNASYEHSHSANSWEEIVSLTKMIFDNQ